MAVAAVSQKFAEALDEKFETKQITVMAGRRYDRIVGSTGDRLSTSVHAFVERETGKLFKAAGWPGPAKGARYDLSTPEGFAHAVEVADSCGRYLYQN